jgi:hypothetical protein
MQYRSQTGLKQPSKLARRLLRKMREAQAMGILRRAALVKAGERIAPAGVQV